jgi:retinol dehydrogenase 12
MTLTINHFGHFYLTYLLFEKIVKSPSARIINVSSMAHYSSPNNMLEDLDIKSSSFSSISQYNKSKFFNVLFTVGLADRLSKFQHIKTVCLHPGIIDSGFGQGSCLIGCFKCLCCCLFKSS